MATIFISYSHRPQDEHAMQVIPSQIENIYGTGSYWYDRGLQGGSEWWESIKIEIQMCQIFLLLVSDSSVQSEYCVKEIRHALRHKKPVLPVILPTFYGKYQESFPSDLQKTMNKLQYIDIQRGYEDLSKIWGALNHLLTNLRLPLSITDRWILFNQFQIMDKIGGDDKGYDPEYYEKSKKVLELGYELYYEEITNHVFPKVFPKGDGQEIMDIFEMFRMMKDAYSELEEKTGINDDYVYFQGFDSNTEEEEMAFAKFSVEVMGRYSSLEIKNYKAYKPKLPKYRAMLKEWQKSNDVYTLTKDDLIRITNAPISDL